MFQLILGAQVTCLRCVSQPVFLKLWQGSGEVVAGCTSLEVAEVMGTKAKMSTPLILRKAGAQGLKPIDACQGSHWDSTLW